MICLSTTQDTLRGAVSAVVRNSRWLDLVELRADFLSPEELARAAAFPALIEEALGRKIPIILTLRRVRDGGQYRGTDSDRLGLLNGLVEGGHFDYLDLEEDLLEDGDASKLAQGFAGRLIRSFHDVHGTPRDLGALFRRLGSNPGEIPKLAVRATGTKDVRRVVELMVETAGRERIVLGMGEAGFPTRILGRRFGCFLSYTSDLDVPGAIEAAPGHLSPRALSEVFHYADINSATRIFGIIGNPVLHSKSPAYHTAAFRDGGYNGLYLPFPTEDLDAFFEMAEAMELQGLSVTIPHKEAVRRFLKSEDPAVSGAGACNTVIRTDAGWHGTNTDVPGFLEPLESAFDGGLEGRSVTVIGAGGAARGAVYALVKAGAKVLVLNRTLEKARRLSAEIPGPVEAAGIDAEGIERAHSFRDVVVQTTSVGMTPEVEKEPLPGLAFTGGEVAYDMIYTPEETRFLKRAREAGCRTISGKEMFRRQAELQQELFRTRF